MTRYRWVSARKAEGFPTTAACAVARVTLQGFYAWCRRCAAGPTAAESAEAEVVREIRSIHAVWVPNTVSCLVRRHFGTR